MAKQYPDALTAATNWFVHLTSGEATEQDHQAWRTWLEASDEHKRAWDQVKAVTDRFMGLEAKTSLSVLDRTYERRQHSAVNQERRSTIKNLAVLFALGTASWYGYKEKPWHILMADYKTGVGEVKHVTLDDGTRLTLNTNTMLSVHYDEQARHIKLLQGEVHIETAVDDAPVYRPFVVSTQHGTAKALGTRFITRTYSGRSCVNVYEGAVEVVPVKGGGDKVVVNAGETVKFTEQIFQQKLLLDPASDAWMRGFIIADKMPLKVFLNELSRYRTGMFRCDPKVEQLEISGAFPIDDVDAVLKSISQVLPVKIEHYTPYWTMIKPA